MKFSEANWHEKVALGIGYMVMVMAGSYLAGIVLGALYVISRIGFAKVTGL